MWPQDNSLPALQSLFSPTLTVPHPNILDPFQFWLHCCAPMAQQQLFPLCFCLCVPQTTKVRTRVMRCEHQVRAVLHCVEQPSKFLTRFECKRNSNTLLLSSSEGRQPLLKINQRDQRTEERTMEVKYIWMSPKLCDGGHQALGCPLKTCSFITFPTQPS